ncbi:hypothetical protein TetV_381 [Tetraselmis virus 1]|uniref:Uncharacterized protein n=1 Tax=Tetraselmis virus 1 TaxID=2060617 RepID=A0A2P0VNJ2_9VIRU|nr:hypothetical protein QJ968_gp381 [Tetraselmis virus 1]AUF82473.1 hypothetical protein TetV_381 [Tetraselmis virus 1]
MNWTAYTKNGQVRMMTKAIGSYGTKAVFEATDVFDTQDQIVDTMYHIRYDSISVLVPEKYEWLVREFWISKNISDSLKLALVYMVNDFAPKSKTSEKKIGSYKDVDIYSYTEYKMFGNNNQELIGTFYNLHYKDNTVVSVPEHLEPDFDILADQNQTLDIVSSWRIMLFVEDERPS